jgi:hypothetical protein
VPSSEIRWPSETDLCSVEYSELILLSRVLAGLRRLSDSDEPQSGVAMTRATRTLVDVLMAVEARAAVLRAQLADSTATPAEQREFADQAEEMADLLRTYADDIDAGIVAAPRPLPHTE